MGCFITIICAVVFREGRDAFARAAEVIAGLGVTDESFLSLWAQLLSRQGWFTFHAGRHLEALALLNESVDKLRPLSDHRELIFSLNYLSAVYLHVSNYENALATAEESLQTGKDN